MTLISLYRAVLVKLQIAQAGESADPEVTQVVSDLYPSLYDMLHGRRLVAWTVTDDIPEFAVIPLTSMLAFLAAPSFGKDAQALAPEGALGLPQVSLAERQLRSDLAKQYVSYPQTSEYF